MKIEVGRLYKDKDGRKVQIMNKDNGMTRQFDGYIFPTVGDVADYWAYSEDGSTSGNNLVEEWKEPRISEAWVVVYDDSLEQACANLQDAQRIVSGATLHLTYNHDTGTPSVEVVK